MITLVAGSACSGKSTFIEQSGIWSENEIVFGIDLLKNGLPSRGVVHYNLLRHAATLDADETFPKQWSLLDEPGFAALIQSGRIERAIVIVAPVSDLVARAPARGLQNKRKPKALAKTIRCKLKSLSRTLLRRHLSTDRKPKPAMTDIIAKVDHLALYQQLLDILEKAGIPYELKYSGGRTYETIPVFTAIDRSMLPRSVADATQVPQGDAAGVLPSGSRRHA